MTYPTTLRNSVVAELIELAQVRGAVPTVAVEEAAKDLKCSPSTIWRWLAEASDSNSLLRDPADRGRIAELKPSHIEVVFAHNVNLRSAKRELDKTDPEIAAMSESTFRRRWRQVDPAVRAMAVSGGDGLLASQLRTVFTTTERNAVWQVDAMEIPVWAVPQGHQTQLVKPWLITVIDDFTRRIMSTLLIFGRPSADDAAVALADAMMIRRLSDGTEVGGLPATVRSDNGSEFKNDLIDLGARRLGITRTRSYPHRKNMNGKVERVQRTMQDEFFSTLPGYTGGPRTLSRRDLFGEDAAVLDAETLYVLLGDWVDEYNSTRPHSSLDGLTPNQVWAASSTPLSHADPEAIRLALMASENSYKVHQRGIHFHKRYYTAPELAPLVGSKVDVRYLPRDESFIEVFIGDDWVCTAFLHANLTGEQRSAISERNRKQYTTAREYVRTAAARRRAAALADPNVLTTAPLVPDSSQLAADPEALLSLLESGDSEGLA